MDVSTENSSEIGAVDVSPLSKSPASPTRESPAVNTGRRVTIQGPSSPDDKVPKLAVQTERKLSPLEEFLQLIRDEHQQYKKFATDVDVIHKHYKDKLVELRRHAKAVTSTPPQAPKSKKEKKTPVRLKTAPPRMNRDDTREQVQKHTTPKVDGWDSDVDLPAMKTSTSDYAAVMAEHRRLIRASTADPNKHRPSTGRPMTSAVSQTSSPTLDTRFSGGATRGMRFPPPRLVPPTGTVPKTVDVVQLDGIYVEPTHSRHVNVDAGSRPTTSPPYSPQFNVKLKTRPMTAKAPPRESPRPLPMPLPASHTALGRDNTGDVLELSLSTRSLRLHDRTV